MADSGVQERAKLPFLMWEKEQNDRCRKEANIPCPI